MNRERDRDKQREREREREREIDIERDIKVVVCRVIIEKTCHHVLLFLSYLFRRKRKTKP